MASDNLTQLGRTLRQSQNQVDHTIRRVSENFPMIETLRDTVGVLLPFKMEFFTYNKSASSNIIHLNVSFSEPFDDEGVLDISQMPLTITQAGVDVGLDGEIGLQGIWYPLVRLGDLNFEGSPSFTIVFDISTFGTGTYQHKIVFADGGVNLTSATTITGSTITVLVERANVLSPPKTIMRDAYIYGLVTGFSIAGWLHYAAASVFDSNGLLYTPRVIGV